MHRLNVPLCFLVSCFSLLSVEKRLRCDYCGASFLATYPRAGWRWPLSHLQFCVAFMFWQDDTTELSAALKLLQRTKSLVQMVFGDLPVRPHIFMASVSKIVQNLFDLTMLYCLSWDCNLVFKQGAEALVPLQEWWYFPCLAHSSVSQSLLLVFRFLFCGIFKRCKEQSRVFLHAWFVAFFSPKVPRVCKLSHFSAGTDLSKRHYSEMAGSLEASAMCCRAVSGVTVLLILSVWK